MIDQLIIIIKDVFLGIAHIWPYLLITIPLSVAIQLFDASKYINGALKKKPFIAIILATLVGAFSPFCSCGVIPVIASLLIGGVPLAPIMSFWIASPSMDPEIFFLSVAQLGWSLAIWRLISTLCISLAAGFITQILQSNGFLGNDVLRRTNYKTTRPLSNTWKSIRNPVSKVICRLQHVFALFPLSNKIIIDTDNTAKISCCSEQPELGNKNTIDTFEGQNVPKSTIQPTNTTSCSCKPETKFYSRLFKETKNSVFFVMKFMILAFFLKSIIKLYVPSEVIIEYIGESKSFLSIFIASVLGIPFYTSNIAALPLVSELLTKGMNPGGALAFLITGPITTLPAMVAVWGITNRKVFFLYVGYSFFGAIIFGLLYVMIAPIM